MDRHHLNGLFADWVGRVELDWVRHPTTEACRRSVEVECFADRQVLEHETNLPESEKPLGAIRSKGGRSTERGPFE